MNYAPWKKRKFFVMISSEIKNNLAKDYFIYSEIKNSLAKNVVARCLLFIDLFINCIWPKVF